jgi:squalene synthase HpnC
LSSQDVIPAKAGIQLNKVLDPGFRRGDGFLSSLPPEAAAPLNRTWSQEEAFQYCTALTKSHYENFPVGSFLVPKALQPAIHSLYAFMRTADDFSDEKRRPGDDQERLSYLNTWDKMLTECEQGRAQHPIFVALQVTLERYQLPAQWLRDLLMAFKMDCTVRRYQTYEDLLTYCRYSANPVGRLILTLFGCRSEELYQLSDAVCTGLQLANHWQDVAVDLQKDRIYLPQEDLKRFDVVLPSPTGRGAGGEATFQKLMAFEVARTRGVFEKGQPLPGRVRGRLRVELGLTWRGGVCILDKIEAADYDVFNRRPVVTKADWLHLGVQALTASLFHG